MHEPIATAETHDYTRPDDARRLAGSPQRKGDKMRFHYASGSHPLDGYTIKRGIGAGGFGEVYFATSDAGKEVALKRIQRNLDVELRGVRQCLNLKHINLISLWDIKYDDQGEAWVVMEYIAGESLRDVVERFPQGMPDDEVRQWFDGIAAGVAYLHDHGIVHRDLKPGNIFEDDGVVKIGDYGLSKFISCSRRSGQTESVGTCHYMAPEIGKGSYGKEIDIYALGVILYELLSGNVPFDGESSQEIIMKHLTAEPDVATVPAAYRRVIRKALVKDPQLRYSDVREMLQDLGAEGRVETQRGSAETQASSPSVLVIGEEEDGSSPMYISDPDDIVMGDVQEIVDAESTRKPPRQSADRRHLRNDAAAAVAAGAAAASRSAAQPQDEEPIARAVQSSWSGIRDWWNHANFSTPVKVLLLIVAALVLIVNAQWLIPVAVVLGIAYLVYRGVRSATTHNPHESLVGHSQPRDDSPDPQHAAVASSTGKRCRRRRSRELLRQVLNKRTATERLTELTGSMLVSALACGVLSVVAMVVAMLVGDASFDDGLGHASFFAWLTLVTVTGSWMVLCVGKLFEVTGDDQIRQRFVMLVAGLALGVAAFGFYHLVQPTLEFQQGNRPFAEVFSLPSSMASGSEALLPAYLAYFGGLFVILRWWRQTDALRRSRLSLWSTALCVLWALVIDVFPQPWGFLLAATISISVQLSAPWMSPQERSQVRQQHQQA